MFSFLWGGQPRHKDWPKESKLYLKANPTCVWCKQDAEVVHHIVPVGVDHRLEMVKSNWASMCDRCHFCVGHGCNWRKYNVYFAALIGQAEFLPIVCPAMTAFHIPQRYSFTKLIVVLFLILLGVLICVK